jgi:hypothetical protein
MLRHAAKVLLATLLLSPTLAHASEHARRQHHLRHHHHRGSAIHAEWYRGPSPVRPGGEVPPPTYFAYAAHRPSPLKPSLGQRLTQSSLLRDLFHARNAWESIGQVD